MKKTFKIIGLVFAVILTLLLACTIYFFAVTLNVKLDESKLINLDKTVTFYDKNDHLIVETANKTPVTNFEKLPTNLKNAFIAVEDKRFYSHNGVDTKGLARAFINNVKTFSFKEGASTISQQLIKNTHLSNEKTLKRKLYEIKLSLELEKRFSKDEIMEMYLNTIYFGDNCFGITNASEHYFSKTPSELSLGECAMLAGLIKAPSNYSPYIDIDKSNSRKNLVLSLMREQGYIDENEFNKEKNNVVYPVEFENTNYGYINLARKEIGEIFEKARHFSKKFKVYTYYDEDLQESIEKRLKENDCECEKSCVVMDKNSKINAYTSTCGVAKRQLGSTIKPLVVYAPAIETDVVDSCTLIDDVKTDFNGYSPSNFNEKYYGMISVKDAFAKSLNVPAVKILNYTGIEKAISFINKTNIDVTENDKGLSLALGGTEKGGTLLDISSAYSIFTNKGLYSNSTTIKKIVNEDGKIIYQDKILPEKVFSENTVTIINDMMKNTVENGTAKQLHKKNQCFYAKTGTVGNEKGNTDAYTISYTKDFIIGTWLGNVKNKYMDNSITGGSVPARITSFIWHDIYNGEAVDEIMPSDDVENVDLDSISYAKNELVLADENAPERYKIPAIFKKSRIPKITSLRFSRPEIENAEIFVNNNSIYIRLCQTELIDIRIFNLSNGKKECVFDTRKNTLKNGVIDCGKYLENKTYIFSIVPYYTFNDKEFIGNEQVLKIKTPSTKLGDKWWIDEFD